ncbi:hypothetical protein BJ944DRAFT_245603 [Cunninghamella echinulata]|nr:hypothetical protein BJ944DRAFT_245603 [Cunninghamella echinulata]
MFANTPYFPGYNQSQPPNTSGMNASQTQVPDHTQLSLPTPTSLPANYNPQMQEFAKPKRKQVKNACVNCQKACKKCDEQRPCPRCVKYGLTETCVDSVRKERKKGIKRGPYKKRKQANGVSADGSPQPTSNMSVSTLANGIYATANPTATTTADGRPNTQTTTTANMGYANYPSTNQFDSFPGFQGQSLQYLQQYGAMSLILQQAGNNVAASVANAVNSNNANGDNKTQEDGHNNGKPVDDDDGNKLSILSQLCTAVLDTVPNPAGTTNTTTTNTNTTTTSTTNNNNTTSSELKETKQENSTNSTPSQNNNHSHEPTETEEKKVKADPDAGTSNGEKVDNK